MKLAVDDLTALREALLDLPNSGPTGFEGLLATVFAKLLGVPFRLAKSGYQFGVDGKSADPELPVGFEAKLYKDDVPSSEVLNKIGALAIRDDPIELWVLGTTGVVTTQPADALEALASKHGYSTLILDWQADTPQLPAVLAAAHVDAAEFLTLHVPTTGLAQKAASALLSLSAHAELTLVARAAVDRLRAASVAAPIALEANGRWLRQTLSDRRLAKSRLGQALSPLASVSPRILNRNSLIGELRTSIQAQPADRLIAVLGDDGNGKSWLTMQSWAELPLPTLTVVFSPEELSVVPSGSNWDLVLSQKLLAQTGETSSDATTKRWLQRLDRWRRAAAFPVARLLVVVDGLNQRPNAQWGHLLDSLVPHVFALGGCTVATSRTEFFRRSVEPRLMSPVTSIVVPGWTPPERDEILAAKGVTAESLHPDVAKALLNPRLLGLAFSLLDAETLQGLDSLSVPQLIFEYLRMIDREGNGVRSAQEFADMLQSHAKDILDRVRSAARDDLTVFEQLEPAAEGQFFQLLEGENHRYTLRDQGLTYALGLAVVDELRGALRNQHDLHEALVSVLEPIAALDRVADATLAALTLACLDSRIHEQIGAALLGGFTQMQNPDEALFKSFREMARRRVRVFCMASERAWMEPTHLPNEDWLESSLQSVKNHPEVLIHVKQYIERWLRFWWPDERVEYMAHGKQGSPADERSRWETERDQRIADLGKVEKEYLSYLIRQDTSPYRLMALAFRLCAGLPLSELANSIACASFSMALTPSAYAPDDDLCHLVKFNRRDWSVTRSQLIAHAQRLSTAESSICGRWAGVTLLNATGAADDSVEAHRLASELTKDRHPGISWRRVEHYCVTDPCDPSSQRAENIDTTALDYAKLDVSKLKLFMGTTNEDNQFETALPGLSRFVPEVAVRKHREFLGTIQARRGLPLRQATLAGLNDSALVDRELAGQLLALSIRLSEDSMDVDSSSVEHVQQSLLLTAYPQLSPEEQQSGLLAVVDPELIWLEVLRIAKQGSPSQLMETAQKMEASNLRVLIPLALARRVADRPLPGFSEMLPDLLASPHSSVRSAALSLAGATSDRVALRAVVASGWTAASLSRTGREHITGSMALIQAAKIGVVRGTEVLSRIAPETYGAACGQLDREAVEQLASMLDACVRESAGFDQPLPPIEIKLSITRDADAVEARLSLTQPPPAAHSIADTLKRLAEREKEFEERQERLHKAYETFAASVNPRIAALALEAFSLAEMQALLKLVPEVVQGWIEILQVRNTRPKPALRNFGLLLAAALTHEVGKLTNGINLISLLQHNSSYVQIKYTAARLPLESVVLWWAANAPEVNELRFARLDRCESDHELAREAASALYAGKSAILEIYARERLNSPIPVDVARAITVIGFSDDEKLAAEVISAHEESRGLLGAAAKNCRIAMDRHLWSKHWFECMRRATSGEDFWAASTIFLKVVDARFDALHRSSPSGTEVFNAWWWSTERRLQQRFEKWSDKRKKTLFGLKLPNSIYLLA